jgi:cytochrome oxidase Cu insertion factor (SCO1/SenC/PrrC family)
MNNDLAALRDTVSRMMVPLLWCHVPLAAGIGGCAGNGWLWPGAMAAAIAAVATAAWLRDPAGPATRLTIGVALMGMVSILVAACAGSHLQIDVHMYYFAGLAVLAAYCDRNVILASAAVAAISHLTLNFLAPALVFPEGADFPRVLLHAAILIIETAALMWLTTRIVTLFTASAAHLSEALAASKMVASLAEQAAAERRLVDAERQSAEAARAEAGARQSQVVTAMATGLSRLARGNLAQHLDMRFAAEYEPLRNDFKCGTRSFRSTADRFEIETRRSGPVWPESRNHRRLGNILTLRRPLRLGLFAACFLAATRLGLDISAAQTQTSIGGPFTLIDGAGRSVTDRDFEGKTLLVFFGYTNCPDLCPTTLNTISQSLKLLGQGSKNIQPLFITVDPARDSPALIDRYVALFSPRITGLSGSPAQLQKVEREYHVYVGPTDPKTGAINHSAILYLIGPDGRFITALNDGLSAGQLAAQLKHWSDAP